MPFIPFICCCPIFRNRILLEMYNNEQTTETKIQKILFYFLTHARNMESKMQTVESGCDTATVVAATAEYFSSCDTFIFCCHQRSE